MWLDEDNLFDSFTHAGNRSDEIPVRKQSMIPIAVAFRNSNEAHRMAYRFVNSINVPTNWVIESDDDLDHHIVSFEVTGREAATDMMRRLDRAEKAFNEHVLSQPLAVNWIEQYADIRNMGIIGAKVGNGIGLDERPELVSELRSEVKEQIHFKKNNEWNQRKAGIHDFIDASSDICDFIEANASGVPDNFREISRNLFKGVGSFYRDEHCFNLDDVKDYAQALDDLVLHSRDNRDQVLGPLTSRCWKSDFMGTDLKWERHCQKFLKKHCPNLAIPEAASGDRHEFHGIDFLETGQNTQSFSDRVNPNHCSVSRDEIAKAIASYTSDIIRFSNSQNINNSLRTVSNNASKCCSPDAIQRAVDRSRPFQGPESPGYEGPA